MTISHFRVHKTSYWVEGTHFESKNKNAGATITQSSSRIHLPLHLRNIPEQMPRQKPAESDLTFSSNVTISTDLFLNTLLCTKKRGYVLCLTKLHNIHYSMVNFSVKLFFLVKTSKQNKTTISNKKIQRYMIWLRDG